MRDIDLSGFLKQHQLPDSYSQLTEQWFGPLAEEIATHQKGANKPIVVGINGAQGSGKSTLAQLLAFLLKQRYQLNTISLSLDDFYLSAEERQTLAKGIHPLLATRGVPGTHDIALARKTLSDLLHHRLPVAIPRFNKANDDRYPAETFEQVTTAIDVIVLEGWCLGSEAQTEAELVRAVNDLEINEDPDQAWRHYVNEQLKLFYPSLFELVDLWIMLKAPSFDCVYNWRLEQENKLAQSASGIHSANGIMDAASLARFIKFYQRITEHTLQTLPQHVNYLFELDDMRHILRLIHTPPAIPDMHIHKRWLIYTDLDGSLLDHYNYRFDEAAGMLTILESRCIPVIPVSSKTQAELELLRDSLNNYHPFIVENGAAVFIPKGYFRTQPEGTTEKGNFWVKEFVEPRHRWQAMIESLRPRYADQFQTFADAGIDGIITMTGLNVHAAARAARREYGEPVCWHGNGTLKQQFIEELEQMGAHTLQGGRFLHVSGDCNKGQALAWLTELYQSKLPQHSLQTLAIGDSQNDKAMLEKADVALLIRSPAHSLPLIERDNNLFISDTTGPRGWAEGVATIINATLHSDSPSLPRGHHG